MILFLGDFLKNKDKFLVVEIKWKEKNEVKKKSPSKMVYANAKWINNINIK